MPTPKQLAGDLLFLAQIALAIVFGGSEFRRLLTTAQGIPIFWLACWLAFLLVNLTLTIRAHLNRPSRVTFQALGCYALWTVIIASAGNSSSARATSDSSPSITPNRSTSIE